LSKTSKIIAPGHASGQQIEAFALPEIDSSALSHQGSLVAVPTVIRDAAECPYAIEAYSLSDMPSTTEGMDLRETMGSEAAAGAPLQTLPSVADTAPELAAPSDVPKVAGRPDPDAVWQQVQQDVARYRAQAQQEAEQCLAQAQARAEALAQEAYTDGYKRGEETAQQEVTEQCATLLASLRQALEDLAHVRADALRLAAEDMITLALHLAQKIVHYEVKRHPQVLVATLQRALTYLVDDDHVVIRVNPDDLAQAQALQPRLWGREESDMAPMFRADESIGRGGCVIDSEFGLIDARIEAQFAELEQHLRTHFGQEDEAS